MYYKDSILSLLLIKILLDEGSIHFLFSFSKVGLRPEIQTIAENVNANESFSDKACHNSLVI